MATLSKLLAAKALAFARSIQAMTDKERYAVPSDEYGQDYNALRDKVAETRPDLVPLLPPRVEFSTRDPGLRGWTISSYLELGTYCEQIFQLLSVEDGA